MKMKALTLLNVVLAICLVTALLFTTGTLMGRGGDEAADYTAKGEEYDPWTDVNDDGAIDMADIDLVNYRFGTEGTPITKASLTYDSGWVDITDKTGQYFNITHNLNSTDVIVDIQGKTTPDGGAHQRNLGGTWYISGWRRTYGGPNDDSARSVVQTVDGGYIMVGSTKSFGAGDLDFWLIKTGVESGLAWTDSTADTITLYRGATDAYWNYVRVRIWKIKETP